MLKACGTKNGKPVLILGLSFANLELLKLGKPIAFDAAPFGLDSHLLIFSAVDEAVMARSLLAYNPDIEVNEDKSDPHPNE